MSALTNAAETAILKLIYQNQAFAGVGDSAGLGASADAGNLYISLHSQDPGAAGTQLTNEVTYDGYARVAVPRSSAGWTVSQAEADSVAVKNAIRVLFPANTGTQAAQVRYVCVGTAQSGAGQLLIRHKMQQPEMMEIGQGVAPEVAENIIAAAFKAG